VFKVLKFKIPLKSGIQVSKLTNAHKSTENLKINIIKNIFRNFTKKEAALIH
jgi:hypothetical protein